jgi:hypothetical protein
MAEGLVVALGQRTEPRSSASIALKSAGTSRTYMLASWTTLLFGWKPGPEPPPTMAFPFERFVDAFDAIRSRRAIGKIVVEMNS